MMPISKNQRNRKNATYWKTLPVQVSATASAFIRTAILVAIYTVALFPGINPVGLWIAVGLLVLFSLGASFFTTDSGWLHREQKLFNLANRIESLPPDVRTQVYKAIDRFAENPEAVDLDVEFDKCFSQLTAEEVKEVRQKHNIPRREVETDDAV